MRLGHTANLISELTVTKATTCIENFSIDGQIGAAEVLLYTLKIILARPDDTSSRSLTFRPLHHG